MKNIVVVLGLLVAAGCASTVTTAAQNASGRPSVYNDPQNVGPLTGIGIESQDLVSMTDKMMRDILAQLRTDPSRPARVLIDEGDFHNDGTSRLNRGLITNRLRVELNRAAANRLHFVAPQMRQAPGSAAVIPAQAQYRLTGTIQTLDSRDTKTGLTSRYHQITFEMVDIQSGTIAWSGIYEFKKTGQDDLVYQ